MTLKSISVCPSVRRPPIHPTIPSVRPPAGPPARPPIHPSIYLQIWYRNVLVPKRLGAETSWCRIVQGFYLGWCRNVLVPKRLGPNRLGAETTWCRNVYIYIYIDVSAPSFGTIYFLYSPLPFHLLPCMHSLPFPPLPSPPLGCSTLFYPPFPYSHSPSSPLYYSGDRT